MQQRTQEKIVAAIGLVIVVIINAVTWSIGDPPAKALFWSSEEIRVDHVRVRSWGAGNQRITITGSDTQ